MTARSDTPSRDELLKALRTPNSPYKKVGTLREFHNTAATVIEQLHAEVERYRKGMENWKATAEAKDKEFLSIRSESTRSVTFHGSGEDLATDVHALLSIKERQRFMAKWGEREAEADAANARWAQETRT